MSVAAQLSLLKGLSSSRSAPPTVIHDDARQAAKEPHVELVGAALNALESLSLCDAALKNLAGPLLLTDRLANRDNLDAQRDEAVSNAVVLFAHRIAPSFPTRATQRALEWIVRGIEVGRFGSDAEVDSLMVAALPFYSSTQFVRLSYALLAPQHSGGRRRHKWTWLNPVIEQKLPPSSDFIVKNASDASLFCAIEVLAASAVAGIPINHLAGFLASIISSRLLSPRKLPAQKLSQRALALNCLQAICFKRDKFTTLTGKRKKRHVFSPDAQRQVNRTKISLLIALSTAIAGNALDDDVAVAVLHAAVQTLTSGTNGDDYVVIETAAACITVCVARCGYKPLPFPIARSLAKWGRFAEILESVVDNPGTYRTYEAYLSALASQAPINKKALKALVSGLDVKWDALLSESAIENVLVQVLDAFSLEETSQEEKDTKTNSLVEILKPLARGAFATGLDGALRKHFDERRLKKKKDRKRYLVVDLAISLAMAGTPYVTVKTSENANDEDTISEYTLISCLDHPEPVVRISGIKRLAAEESFSDEVRHRFQDVMLRRIEGESDLRVVTEALQKNLILNFCDPQVVLTALAKQYRDAFSKISEKKKGNLPSRIQNFVDAAENTIEAIGKLSDELSEKCKALLLGWEVAGIRITKDGAETPDQVSTLQQKRFESTSLSTIVSLFRWDHAWGIRAVVKIYQDSSLEEESGVKVLDVVSTIVELCVSSTEVSIEEKNTGIQAMLLCLKNNLKKVDVKTFQALKHLWGVLANGADRRALQAFVQHLASNLGADKLTTLLIESYLNLDSERAKAVSLQWAAVPVKAEKSKNNVDAFVLHVLSAMYSESTMFQRLAMSLCKQINTDDSLEEISENEWTVFQEMERVAKNSDNYNLANQEELGSDYLRPQLFKTLPSLKKLPKSLYVGEATKNTALVSAVFALPDNDQSTSSFVNSHGFISYLRALDGATASSVKSFLAVIDALTELFGYDGDRIIEDELNVEAFARLVLLIPETITAKTNISEHIPLVKLFIARARKLQEGSLTPLLALFGESLATALSKSAMLLRRIGTTQTSAEIDGLANDAVDTLFWLSTQSSSIGEFTVKILSSEDVAVREEDFERITNQLWNNRKKVSVPKRRRTPARKCARRAEPVEAMEYESLLPEELQRTSITGALETLVRSGTPGNQGDEKLVWPASPEIQTNLWGFVRLCAQTIRDGKVTDLAEIEYQLSLVLRILTTVSATVELEPDDAMAVVDICFYPGLQEDIELTATSRTLRAASVALVQELAKSNSSTLSAQIVPFLEHVLETEATDSRKECLATIVPSLIQGGLSVSQLMEVSLNANPDMANEARMNVTDCIRMCDDTAEATVAALKLILTSDDADNISYCVKIIVNSGNSAEQVLQVLAAIRDNRLAKISMTVLGQPQFLQALDDAFTEKNDEKDMRKSLVALDDSFAALFHILLKTEDVDESKQKALTGLIGLVPGSVLCNCLKIALGDADRKLGLYAMQSVLQLLEWNTDITDSWIPEEKEDPEDDPTSSDAPHSFVIVMCEQLKICIQECFEYALNSSEEEMVDTSQLDLGKSAIQVLEKVVKRWNPQQVEVVQACGTLMADLVKNLKIEKDGDVLAVALTCLSAIGRTLGGSGSIFVPTLTGVVANVIEEVLCGEKESEGVISKSDDAEITVLDKSILAVKEVLEFAPKMFGKKSLRRISVAATLTGRESVVQLIYSAVQKVPAAQAIDALSWSLESAMTAQCDAASAVTNVLGGVSKLLENMKKKEIMMYRADIFKVLLSALDFRRRMATGLLGNGERSKEDKESVELVPLVGARDEMEKCRRVESTCHAAIVDMILRLPESKFKELFNQIVVWSERAKLSEDEQDKLENFKVDFVPTLLRFVPLLGLSLELFSKIGKIMVPYFAEILERTLDVIGTNQASLVNMAASATEGAVGSGSKRKRSSVEEEESVAIASGMENMRRSAVKQGLRNVEKFMRVMPEMDTCSEETFTRVQNACIEAFDTTGEASQELRLTITATAQRMLVTDTDRTKEQCRTLICGLSRSILARTRSEEAKTRKDAVILVDNVLDAVGDEYLPALPEAMPVLADVIDDEKDEVARATKTFVRKLELITGQSILEQLKG